MPDWEEQTLAEEITEAEQIEQELAEEREAELERLLELDQRPPAPEAAEPPEKKKLKRELEREALARLEDAARTPEDFQNVIKHWDRLDRNRERRERDHEVTRGDVPLEYGKTYDGLIFPAYLNSVFWRQMQSGNFLPTLYDCPYEMHELISNPFLFRLISELKDEHKELLHYLAVRRCRSTQLAALLGQTDRNIRKKRMRMIGKLQRKLYEYLEKQAAGRFGSAALWRHTKKTPLTMTRTPDMMVI